MTSIPGYTHGTSAVVRSPISIDDLELLKKTALFGDDDVRALKESEPILADQTDAILDVWYGFVGSNPHLLATFADRETKEPIGAYLGAVRARFGRWILDTARADYDQAWLDYQHEIGLRHHRVKKNRTDGANASAIVPFRYLFPLVVPITTTLVPFLGKKGHGPADVERMRAAWTKSCLLQLTLWSQPYVTTGDY